MAEVTFFFVLLDFILEDWESSFLRYCAASEICLSGGMYMEISSVPLPLRVRSSSSFLLKSYRALAVASAI